MELKGVTNNEGAINFVIPGARSELASPELASPELVEVVEVVEKLSGIQK